VGVTPHRGERESRSQGEVAQVSWIIRNGEVCVTQRAEALPEIIRKRGDALTETDAGEPGCAMRCSVISLAERGEIGGRSLDPMANPEPKGKIGDNSMPEN
jgi:hypothetical protein